MIYLSRDNPTKKDSPKVTETKKKIRDAFITLYAKQPIEKIDIKSITDLAGLNRGTFYVYYLDIYDLLAQIEASYYEHIQNNVKYLVRTLFYAETVEEEFAVNFFRENLAYMKVLIATPGKSKLPEVLKEKIRDAMRDELKKQNIYNEPQKERMLEYLLEYIISAHFGVITRWIANDLDLSAVEIISFLKSTFNKICD